MSQTMMSAVAIGHFGGREVLKVQELPVPAVGAQEVLIALDDAGVGIWDLKAREGRSAGEDTRFPYILGIDGAGVVAAVGSRVTRFAEGDRVYSYSYDNPKGGFYAEYVAVAAGNVGTPPHDLDQLHAGAVPTIGLTALQGVDDTLAIRRDETLIIHGASGNVGCLAVQFAKWRGARVLATASGREGVQFVRQLGADEAIDGKHDDITEAVRSFAPGGVDAVLAFVGGKELTKCLDALKRGGRAAYPNGVEPEPRKRKGVKIEAYDATTGVRQWERLGHAIEEAKLQVPIAEVFDLQDAAKAHRRLARGHVLGKIVLKIR